MDSEIQFEAVSAIGTVDECIDYWSPILCDISNNEEYKNNLKLSGDFERYYISIMINETQFINYVGAATFNDSIW